MKKIILNFLCLIIFIIMPCSFSAINTVAPEIILHGTIDNATPFLWERDLVFTAYNQDLDPNADFSSDTKGKFYISIPEQYSGYFYLAYWSFRSMPSRYGWSDNEKLCKFIVISNGKNNVALKEESIPGSFIACSITKTKQGFHMTFHFNGERLNRLKARAN